MKLHAFLGVDPNDDEEGLISVNIGGSWVPLVAADRQRLEDLRSYAQQLARQTGRVIRLVRFDARVDEETITPDRSGSS